MLYLTVLEAPCSTPAPPAMPGRILLQPITRWAAGHLKEEEPVHILVNFPDPAERDALYGMLRIWMELSCASVDIVTAEGAEAPPPHSIVFWDLDSSELLPSNCQCPGCALFLCSRDPHRAIGSYSFHPTGFLIKPVSMEHLWGAMRRCSRMWFSSLMRLEVFHDRIKIGIPFQNLLWVEGTRRGCLIHTSHQVVASREPLYRLEQQLPGRIFTRCQRSFVINLIHVREAVGNLLLLSNGAEIPIGRGNKAAVMDAYHRFCQLRYSK